MPEHRSMSGDIAKASIIIIALTVADKLLAVIKEMVVAHQFGISPELDVFNIAFAFPGIVVLMFTGALGQAFVPLYHGWSRSRSAEEAHARAASLLWLTTLFFTLLTLACWLLSPLIFSLTGYGFGLREKALGIGLEKMLVFLILIDGSGTILTALLQAKKKFFSLQAAPLFVNAVSIVVLLGLAPQLGIQALVWGVLLGAACKAIFMAQALRRAGMSLAPRFALERTELFAFVCLAVPLLGSELFANCNLIVDQIMATSLSAGSVSSLRYAFRIYDMPVQIVILAFSKALFPYISELAGAGDFNGLRRHFTQSIILICLLSFPATGGTVLLSQDLVSLLFQRGAFDAQAAAQTGQILSLYSLGLFFGAYCFVNGVFFAAMQDTKPLLYVGFGSVILNIALNFMLMRLYGVQGIAVSTTLTGGILSAVFVVMLKKRLAMTDFSRMLANARVIAIACAGMVAAGYLARAFLARLGIPQLAYCSATVAVMLFAFCAGLWLLRTPELQGYFGLLRQLARRGTTG